MKLRIWQRATRNGLQEAVTIMWLKWWQRNGIRTVGNIPRYLCARSVEKNRILVTREDRLGTHKMTFRNAASNGGFFALLCARPRPRREGTRNFRSILLRQPRGRRRKFALSHRTPSPSITAATVLSGGDETAIHSKNPTCPRSAVEHVENLTNGTPVKLTANNLYRSTKAESNRLSLVGTPRKAAHEDIDG